jgi:hypothetical protein
MLNHVSYLFQKDISRKLLITGDECRLLMPFSERWGDADLLRSLTEGREAKSSLGVGLGVRLDGMLITLITEMKSSPRTSPPKPNPYSVRAVTIIFNLRGPIT